MSILDEIRSGIMWASDELGVDPLDIATSISYETGGTFDPNIKGPTTKWGTHRGLFQAGEPQAEQYFNSDFSVPSQMKGLVSYLRDTGVKPGMGLLDIYSAINAGAVGKYNASDTAAGGAPGTVRDKVMNQMADHRKKAAALLGGEAQNVGVMPVAAPTPAGPQPASPAQSGTTFDGLMKALSGGEDGEGGLAPVLQALAPTQQQPQAQPQAQAQAMPMQGAQFPPLTEYVKQFLQSRLR